MLILTEASYVRLFRPITGADSQRLSAAELSGDWNKKEKREQAPALHMEFSTGLNIAGSESKSIERRAPLGKIRRLAVGWGVEGDVDDGLEFDGGALFRRGPELPLAQRLHGVGVELIVDAAH